MNLKEEGLFPWKEKSKRELKGIGNLPEKTDLKCKVRSKPKVGGQEYLELYLMAKEKERLEKIGQVIRRIQRQTAKSWTEVEKQTAKVKKTALSAGETGTEADRKARKTRKETPQNPMKTIVLDY